MLAAEEHLPQREHGLVVLSVTIPHHRKMAGAIIENMSTKKLVFLAFFILVFQILSIMVGAFIGK